MFQLRRFSRIIPPLWVFLCGAPISAAPTPQRIAFERGTAIWVVNLDGSSAQRITTGSAPDLSPDGTRIAFHTDESTKKELVRRIAVVDLTTKRVRVFKKEIPSQNCQRAIWSPDGKQILFSIWAGDDWSLATINADGGGFRYVKKPERKYNSYWSTCWAPDGRSFYAQDLDKLYQFAADGSPLKTWELKSLFRDASMNSGSTIAVSPSGRTFLIELDMDNEEAQLPDWEGPPPSLWIWDIASGKATRLTPKGTMAWHGCWLNGKKILFASQSSGERKPSIYRMTVGEGGWQQLFNDANNPSASRQTGDQMDLRP